MTGPINSVRSFINNGYSLEAHLKSIQRDLNATPSGSFIVSAREIIEPFIDNLAEHDRSTAVTMAGYFEIIYLVENKLRSIISSVLFDIKGEKWWSECVPQAVREYADALIKKEIDLAVTSRSQDPLNYVTFGHLSEIIRANHIHFKAAFTSLKGMEKVLAVINNLRAPIAHCGLLAEDEVARLYLAVRDLFRLIRY